MKVRKIPGKSGKRSAKNGEESASSQGRTFNSRTMQIPVEAVFDDVESIKSTHLEIICPGETRKRISLEGKVITIGRDKECSIALPLSNVSRYHAKISNSNEDYTVEDLESTNGTFVNNVRIIRCILHDNDQIRIGEARIIFIKHKPGTL